MSFLPSNISERDILESIYQELVSLRDSIKSIPDYLNLGEVADFHNISRKQLYRRVVESGDFEEGNQYKKIDGEIKVSKSILHLLKRKRKPKTIMGGN